MEFLRWRFDNLRDLSQKNKFLAFLSRLDFSFSGKRYKTSIIVMQSNFLPFRSWMYFFLNFKLGNIFFFADRIFFGDGSIPKTFLFEFLDRRKLKVPCPDPTSKIFPLSGTYFSICSKGQSRLLINSNTLKILYTHLI